MTANHSSPLPDDHSSSSAGSRYPEFGYPVDEIESFEPRVRCLFCKLLIREAIQFVECGHRVCAECYDVRANAADDGVVDCPDEDCTERATKDQTMPDKAFRRELDLRRVHCKFRRNDGCDWSGLLKDYQAHLDERHVLYQCPDCGSPFSTQTQLSEHMSSCPALFQHCPLAPFCTEEMLRKTDLAAHFLTEKHQDTLARSLTGEYQIPEQINVEAEAEIAALKLEFEEKTSSTFESLSTEIQQLNDATAKLAHTSTELSNSIFQTAQDLNNCYHVLKEQQVVRQTLQPSQEKLQKDLEQLHQAFSEMQYNFVDGTLTWRIEHVAEKMADAQSERQTSIFSPAFYSSSTGYKMRVRLFLFGDGNARRTHISLFFQLMKGDYDAILKWPFGYKVTFSLLDQTGNNRHIIDSFYPDVKSSSFQRPRDATNTASGIPKFFPLPMLLQDDNAYVREDTMYIKIIIGLNETPKVLLPFVLTLNPALPNYVQENLIQQEAARHQQQQQQQSATVTAQP